MDWGGDCAKRAGSFPPTARGCCGETLVRKSPVWSSLEGRRRLKPTISPLPSLQSKIVGCVCVWGKRTGQQRFEGNAGGGLRLQAK